MTNRISSTNDASTALPNNINISDHENVKSFADDTFVRYQPTGTTPDILSGVRRIISDFRQDVSFDEIREKINNELINQAYQAIADVLEDGVDPIEKSNLFDTWKDELETITERVFNFSVNHRKILGSIITATKGKDVGDFRNEQLVLFREATYMLKQFRVTKIDSKRIITKLLSVGLRMSIPLAVDDISEKNTKELEELIESLLNKSK